MSAVSERESLFPFRVHLGRFVVEVRVRPASWRSRWGLERVS